MKKLPLLPLAFLASLTLSACSASKGGSSTNTETATAAVISNDCDANFVIAYNAVNSAGRAILEFTEKTSEVEAQTTVRDLRDSCTELFAAYPNTSCRAIVPGGNNTTTDEVVINSADNTQLCENAQAKWFPAESDVPVHALAHALVPTPKKRGVIQQRKPSVLKNFLNTQLAAAVVNPTILATLSNNDSLVVSNGSIGQLKHALTAKLSLYCMVSSRKNNGKIKFAPQADVLIGEYQTELLGAEGAIVATLGLASRSGTGANIAITCVKNSGSPELTDEDLKSTFQGILDIAVTN